MIGWFRRRKKALPEPEPRTVNASTAGKVVSIKVGESRARISVEGDDGSIEKYFVHTIWARPGRRVEAGQVLGLLDE